MASRTPRTSAPSSVGRWHRPGARSATGRVPAGPSRHGPRRSRAGRGQEWSGVSVAERIVWRSLRANSSAPSRPSPTLAGRTTRAGAPRTRPGRSGPWRRRHRVAAGRPMTAASSAAASAARQGLVDQLADAGELGERGLGLESADRSTVGRAHQRLASPVQQGRHPVQPTGDARQPIRERGELARRGARNRPSPSRYTQSSAFQRSSWSSSSLNRCGGELASRTMSRSSAWSRTSIAGSTASNVGAPVRRRRPAARPARRPDIGPAIVVAMVADGGGGTGLSGVRRVEVGGGQVREGGHGVESSGDPVLARRYHRRVVTPAAPPRPGSRPSPSPVDASGWSRSPSAISTTSRRVAFDAEVWRWTIARPIDDAGLRSWLATALANAAAGTEVPFATIHLEEDRAIGSSRFMTIAPEHRRVEIGWTWVGTAFQRTGANREAKLLQLTHAFETLGARAGRVQDPRPEPRLARRAARHRGDVRRRPAPPHDHARRLEPRLGVLRRHRARVAGGQGPARSKARPVSAAPSPIVGPVTTTTTTRPASRSGS